MSQGMSSSSPSVAAAGAATATATASNVGGVSDSDLIAYQNYFSFNPTIEIDKRKNIVQSCTHCQKAQLSCDGDNSRKKIKLNVPNSDENNELYSSTASVPFAPADGISNPSFIDTSQLFNFSLADFGFGSETTGLEYGILGNMAVDGPPPPSTPSTTQMSEKSQTTSATTPNTPATTTSASSPNTFQALSALFPFTSSPTSPLPQRQQRQQQQRMQQQQHQQQQQQQQLQFQSPMLRAQQPQSKQYNSPPIAPVKRDSTSSSTSTKSTSRRKGNCGNTPEAVYNSVKRPFNYAEGFHYLIQYVTERMAREDLMRISKSLSLFRPSFLSLIMNLTEEDLVFMERCIQRTLLEYEKLISFSGTPTVVWRRTGEVCLVGKEFSLLTQWTRDMLLNKKTYIYELMENQSAVEYWEKFSTHAFDNTDKACSYSCILRTPQQKPVPCTFCFTIKRDIFDLPSVIVGNFLPILS
ncbi:hypothetical protein [Parasitella parasitica]|uniref:ERT1/acuK family PAS domain-containing protein n=1 Tax=Parasitella parasitica TaxID=35722 RepID=A0A0B7MTS2_9FUNG|nr:hypothetical protein [Parasitella parasitica]